MAFSNEYISPKDRALYQLEAFDSKIPRANPSRSWSIERERDLFLRVVRPRARGSEPADPDAQYERDFHFHWKAHELLIELRVVRSEEELQGLPGEIFESGRQRDPDALILRYFIRAIRETAKPSPEVASALTAHRQALLSDLEDALGVSWGGICILSPENIDRPRFAVLKIAAP